MWFTVGVLQLLRSTLKSVLTLAKVGGGGGCFGAQRDLAPEEVGVLTSLSEESLWYPYLLDYRAVLEQSSDFSSIWFREFYLELTRQVRHKPISPPGLDVHGQAGRVTH